MNDGEQRVESPSRHSASLNPDFLILLDMDMGVALEDTDLLLWEFNAD
jgi:hypothetical protein